MTKKKKYVIFIFGILFLSFLVIGATFAYLMLSVDVTNGRYAGVTDCMIIDYDITNDDGNTSSISGTLFQSSTPKGGLSGKVTMNINSTCTFSSLPATIHLNIDSSTSSLLLSEGALKYAVYENDGSQAVSEGVITTTGNITVYQGFNVTQTLTSYYIYVWLDGNIADNDYVNLSFSGAISASVVQNEVASPYDGTILISGNNVYGETLVSTLENDTGATYTYQWYYNDTPSTTGGTEIEGATSDKYTIGNGLVNKYIYLVATSSDGQVVSNVTESKVVPIVTNVTSGSSEKTYDGLVLTNSNCTATNLLSGHSVSCTTSGSLINAGSQDNTIYSVVIKDSAGNDVTANYTIKKTAGELKVYPKNVSVVWGNGVKFLYNGNMQAPSVESVINGVNGEMINVVRTAEVNIGTYTSVASCESVTNGQKSCGNYVLTNNSKGYSILDNSQWTWTIKYWLGDGTGNSKEIGSQTCLYGTDCVLTKFADLEATFPLSSGSSSDNYWEFYNWGTADYDIDLDGNYSDGQTVNDFSSADGEIINLYAIGRKTFKFYSGYNPSTPDVELYQYWNSHSTNASYLTDITIPTPTSIDGWTFVGYKGGSSPADSSVDFAASTVGTSLKPSYDQYRLIRSKYSRTVSIVFNANGGTGTMNSLTATQYYNSGCNDDGIVNVPTFNLPANEFTKTGYTFVNWKSTSTGNIYENEQADVTHGPGVNEEPTSTLEAQWRINRVYIRYSVNGGSITESTISNGTTYTWTTDSDGIIYRNGSLYQAYLSYGTAFADGSNGLANYNNSTYVEIKKTGYSGVSGAEWKCLDGCSNSNAVFSQSTLYNASDFCDASVGDCTVVLGVNWTKNTYTITYDANGGTDAPSAQTKTYGQTLTLSSTVPTRTGYIFIGWSTSSTATTATYQAGGNYTSNAAATLYAVWKNKPELDSGMIPVTIADNGTVTTVSEDDETWFNYDNKQWANAVLVKASGTQTRTYYKENPGTVVSSADILAYYVWIPRYKYKLWTVGTSASGSEQTIEIAFENKSDSVSTGTTVGSWRTHPAFVWDGSSVAGIWVGKFETTGSTTTPTILPNSASVTTKNVGTQFLTSIKFAGGTKSGSTVTFSGSDTYGLTTITDSHMMKNSEWGAVAYLSHSIYGINSEIRLNNYYNSGYKTGCGASTASGAEATTCQIVYGSVSSYPQSTTGNISGIFDMSGGAWEYVMGNYNGTVASSGFSPLPAAKYYDKYTTTTVTTACSGGLCYGHALSETQNWYGDALNMFSSSNPWVGRGQTASGTTVAGIFTSSYFGGGTFQYSSWRTVLVMP